MVNSLDQRWTDELVSFFYLHSELARNYFAVLMTEPAKEVEPFARIYLAELEKLDAAQSIDGESYDQAHVAGCKAILKAFEGKELTPFQQRKLTEIRDSLKRSSRTRPK